jgi:hypothetical protein
MPVAIYRVSGAAARGASSASRDVVSLVLRLDLSLSSVQLFESSLQPAAFLGVAFASLVPRVEFALRFFNCFGEAVVLGPPSADFSDFDVSPASSTFEFLNFRAEIHLLPLKLLQGPAQFHRLVAVFVLELVQGHANFRLPRLDVPHTFGQFSGTHCVLAGTRVRVPCSGAFDLHAAASDVRHLLVQVAPFVSNGPEFRFNTLASLGMTVAQLEQFEFQLSGPAHELLPASPQLLGMSLEFRRNVRSLTASVESVQLALDDFDVLAQRLEFGAEDLTFLAHCVAALAQGRFDVLGLGDKLFQQTPVHVAPAGHSQLALLITFAQFFSLFGFSPVALDRPALGERDADGGQYG